MPTKVSSCPYHKILNKLKTFAGLPVPAITKWVEGKPDFRQLNEPEYIKCVNERRCAICMGKLGEYAWWIGGEKCATNHFFNDPPMHLTCAKESMRLCPFLNGKKRSYRGDDLPSHGLMNTMTKGLRMFLMRGATSAYGFTPYHGHILIYAGARLDVMEEFTAQSIAEKESV